MASPTEVADEIDKYVAHCADLTPAELLAIGHTALNVIVLRTKRGLDADHKPFAPYTPEYAARRKKSGRSGTTVDLAVTGHMQQAVIVTTHPGESHLQFMNHAEDVKAEAHNKGVHKQETVRGHSVKPYTRKVQRYTKAGKVRMKKQNVGGHTRLPYQRKMDLPKREWFEVRHPHDVGMIENNAESLIHRKPVP